MRTSSLRTLQLQGAGGADDGLGAVGLLAPHFELRARAIALRAPLDDHTARAGRIVAPHHVDQAEIHPATAEKSQSKPLRHQLRDEAYREHSLHYDFGKAE